MSTNRGLTGPVWERLRTIVFAQETHCGLCGQRVDKTRPDKLPNGRQDPWAKTVDHITPVRYGGAKFKRSNLQLAHRRCQNKQGAQIANAVQRERKHRNRRPGGHRQPGPHHPGGGPGPQGHPNPRGPTQGGHRQGHSRQW